MLIAGVGLLLLISCDQADQALNLPDEVDFNFHIRPILSNNCFLCHGPDESSREADLRLDLESTATADREDGIRAIFKGHAKRSEMIKRVTSDDPDYHMPPPETNKSLNCAGDRPVDQMD